MLIFWVSDNAFIVFYYFIKKCDKARVWLHLLWYKFLSKNVFYYMK